MKLVIRDLAAREILAAARYYRDAAGPRFRKALVDEIGRAFERVLETPSGFPFCDEEKLVRSVLLERFPYRVYYYVDADDLFVIALLHGRRRPGLYRGR